MIDHILLIGFGGPTQPEEILPFLKIVTQGRNIPEERLKEVAHHYEAIGGRSPYNDSTFQFREILRECLKRMGIELPIFIGMRNWNPFLKDTMVEIKTQQLKKGIGMILAPHRSFTSCARYKDDVKAAVDSCFRRNDTESSPHDFKRGSIEYQFLPPWHEHSSFIEAQMDQTKSQLLRLPREEAQKAHILFTTHSIPLEMLAQCTHCNYEQEFLSTSRLIAERLRWQNWSVAYQSRSGNPKQLWLEPDIATKLTELKGKGERNVIVVPVGFLCENAEILFDLDIEAAAKAKQLGLSFFRALTVMHQPKFVQMIKELIAFSFSPTIISLSK